MKYIEFGKLLANARLNSEFAQQVDLALRLDVKQQTISRWEKGSLLPKLDKLKQIVNLLQIEEIEANALFKTAGYATKSTSKANVAFDQPLPLEALSETSFERFCTALVEKLYPDSKVNRFGDKGHKQYGVDIEAIFTSGKYFAFQCKRHTSFGPKKIEDAVKALMRSADKKVIMLSSTASSGARTAMQDYPDWELWDREDITRKLRHDLSVATQISIVDIYFPGQRFALLGEHEPSPWQSTKQFFAGIADLNAGFSQAWQLVGRENELQELTSFANSTESRVLLLTANGGAGKTRLLRALADYLYAENYSDEIYFLSREKLTAKSFEDLGAGRKLLICDDMHERDDAILISDYVANAENNAKLIFSLRQYGLVHLKQQVKNLMLSDTKEIKLGKLTIEQLAKLATQALRHFNADENYAAQLAKYTSDCPLATVIGAKVLGSKTNHPAFLLSEDTFRSELMARLNTQVVKDVSKGLDEKAVGKTLSCIALLQPIHDKDTVVLEAIAVVTKLEVYEVKQIVKRLKEAGIVFSRAEKSRIAPDLLGDFLIENACIDEYNQSTGFAERVFDKVNSTYIENVLLNLGRLDWRKSNGDTRNSHLMDDLWKRLKWEDEYNSPMVDAAIAVAYYQPHHALSFARRLISENHIGEPVVKIISNAAYNYEFLHEACELLWRIGKEDNRRENTYPHHAMRVLKELASPSPNNPIDYVKRVVDFAIGLMSSDENWRSLHSPIDILIGALKTEGSTTTSTMREISMHPFIIAQQAMASERKRIIRVLIGLLSHADVKRAFEAAQAMYSALRFPHGSFGVRTSDENYTNWTEEFRQTLEEINTFLDQNVVAPAVLTRLAESVSWHANDIDGVTTPLAKRIMARLDGGLRAKTIRMLIDGWGHMTRRTNDNGIIVGHEKMLGKVSNEILAEYPKPDTLRLFIEECLVEIAETKREIHGAAFILIRNLAAASASFAKELVTQAKASPQSIMLEYAGLGLTELLRLDYGAAEILVNEILNEGDNLWIVAIAYAQYKPVGTYTETDKNALRLIVSSTQKKVLSYGADAAHQAFEIEPPLGLSLYSSANLALDEQVAHNFLLWIVGAIPAPYELLTSSQIKAILSRLESLPTLEDYWVQEFIKKSLQREPEATLQFLVHRIEHAVVHSDLQYGYLGMRTREDTWEFNTRSDASVWLERLFEWALEKAENTKFRYQFCTFIGALFAPFDVAFTTTLETWGFNKTRLHFDIAVNVLNEAKPTFVFEQTGFVKRLLQNAQPFGDETLRSATSTLYASAITGMRQGIPGEPFPEDIAMLDNAKRMLVNLSSTEPTYKLYNAIKNHAERAIEEQKREGKIIDESELDDD
jgi:transcriptional regulator with XRE-family HTH domain